MEKILLILIALAVSSCSEYSKKNTNQDHNLAAKNKAATYTITAVAQPHKTLSTNNWTNNNENLALAKVEHYLRSGNYLINNAQALQNKDARYQFNYSFLKQDLDEIASSIHRFVNQDKTSQTPRRITPLNKRY